MSAIAGHRVPVALVAATALIVGLIACGGGEGDASPTPGPPTRATEKPSPSATTSPTPQPRTAATATATPSTTPDSSVQEPDSSSEIGPEVAWDSMAAYEALWDAPFDDDNAVVNVMTNNGASPEAVAFYRETDLFAVDFTEAGEVDVVDTFDPRRANSNDDTVLVNGSPRTLVVDSIDVSSLAASPEYLQIADAVNSVPMKEFTVWHWDSSLQEIATSPSGGMSFVFDLLLTDGCHACGIGYMARVAYDFAPDGTYEGWRALEPTGEGVDWLRAALESE